ncbi:MAG TPA: M3 family metallopeptidase [Acidobacteriaceae bacterium]|jgi:thimet oligopeptidase|nr:M3 family metallopeptidase [Acidobacteriaceae bacterium]
MSVGVLGVATAAGAQTSAVKDPLHIWIGNPDAAQARAWADAHMASAQAEIEKLLTVKGPRTVENTLAPFDEAQLQLETASNGAGLLTNASPNKALRDVGDEVSQKVSAAGTALSLNVEVYSALKGIDPKQADAATKYYLEHSLLDYRLNGIDKDAATRERIRKLNDQLTSEILHFQRNIAESQGKVTVNERADLAGLPEDFIARHPAGADGNITITTDEPDYRPVLTYAKSDDLRHSLYLAYNNRAYPANKDLLEQILKTRSELAHELGFNNWAEVATANKLIKNPTNVKALLAELDKAAKPVAHKEYAEILAFAQKQQPGLKEIPGYSAGYWMELYQRTAYGFDSQAVRAYFPFAEVQAGILNTASKLFHVKFVQVNGLELWDPSVTVFDVMDGLDGSGKRLGRIYLDMHPRPGKNKWFNASVVVAGVGDRQLPEARLNGNFAGGADANDPGLMQYSDVVTFFHEFGHMMHAVLGSHQEWAGASSFNIEWDFVEAPSQMLEEFFHDKRIVDGFAKHYKTGETIPDELFTKMLRADAFGRGIGYERQISLANYSLELHDRTPDKVNVDGMWKEAGITGGPWTWVEGNHGFTTFTHLTGYSSNYYTYSLSKVIALDFFQQFDKNNLLEGPAAMRYRKLVLEPGGSKSANDLVHDFLGRPQSYDAFRKWVNEEFEASNDQTAKK